ncbi:MAG TPA: rhodanese-like domain-containing protein, partial [Actinomycetales bacterium]|nr:rhodanese-like domain-containing protein [Actinomycetales bacterium]
KTDFLTGDNLLLPLAGPANRQGRRVADVIMNHRSSARRGNGDRPVYGASILKLFDLDIAAVGWNEKRLRAAGRDYRAIHTHPSSHAGYYPGAGGLSIKLLFDPTTHEILGAQVVGAGNVDKRIDVLATALQAGMRVTELADLELAYAPPFNSAKDPVNMLGYIAEAQFDGLLETIQWHELENAMAAGATLVDVRGADEVANGAIPGSVHVEMDDLRDRLASTDVDDPLLAPEVIVHCAVGLRGYFAARVLQQTAADRGIKVRVRNLDGGIRTWEAGTVKTGF